MHCAAILGFVFHGGASEYPNWIQITAKFESSTFLVLFLVCVFNHTNSETSSKSQY
jgi:succinate dehydrogenase hydrophobic anchor subunit